MCFLENSHTTTMFIGYNVNKFLIQYWVFPQWVPYFVNLIFSKKCISMQISATAAINRFYSHRCCKFWKVAKRRVNEYC